jgi:hypothetical protein
MLPYEFYFKKHENKFMEGEKSVYYGKVKARTQFVQIGNKKKVKFVKQCEKHYDEQQDTSKRLSALLSKAEIKLLFESYGLPTTVPNNFNAYYTKLHYNDYLEAQNGRERFKLISDSFKSLSDSAKAEFAKKYKKVSLIEKLLFCI